jgi:hypothetical protein
MSKSSVDGKRQIRKRNTSNICSLLANNRSFWAGKKPKGHIILFENIENGGHEGSGLYDSGQRDGLLQWLCQTFPAFLQ